MIRVLIVDDSAFMRNAIAMLLEDDPEIEIAGTARDGLEAVRQVQALRPDVMTLDVEMPRMDGLSALKIIMAQSPLPVLMVSSQTAEGAGATVEALQAGAVDFITKEQASASLDLSRLKTELRAKLKAVASSSTRFLRRRPAPAPHEPLSPAAGTIQLSHDGVVVIGVSTGGPFSLQSVIPALPAHLPAPVVVAQHMPPRFTRSLADRLHDLSSLPVCEAESGMVLRPGRVYIAPGGRNLAFASEEGAVRLVTVDTPDDAVYKPSVDDLFTSAAEVFGSRALAVVMTGMGRDGLRGARRLKEAGARVMAQDEATSVVYGMPRAVVEAGLADAVLPLGQISAAIAAAVGCPAYPARASVRV